MSAFGVLHSQRPFLPLSLRFTTKGYELFGLRMEDGLRALIRDVTGRIVDPIQAPLVEGKSTPFQNISRCTLNVAEVIALSDVIPFIVLHFPFANAQQYFEPVAFPIAR